MADGHKFSAEKNKACRREWVLCLGVYSVSAFVCLWLIESQKVLCMSLGVQLRGLSRLWICSQLMGLRAIQLEPQFYWVAPAEIDPAF